MAKKIFFGSLKIVLDFLGKIFLFLGILSKIIEFVYL